MQNVVRHIALGMPARYVHEAFATGEMRMTSQGYTSAAVWKAWSHIRQQCESAIK